MTRDDIADVTYEAALELNRLKEKYGIHDQKTRHQIEERITREQQILHGIDEILAKPDATEREHRLSELMQRFDYSGSSTLCHEHEMKWPVHLLRFNPFRIFHSMFER